MTRTDRSALMLLVTLFVVALLAAPSVSAALTVTQVKVVVGGVTYCDTTIGVCDVHVWNLGGGVTLGPGQTLILTQTAEILGFTGHIGGNFDTSDRFPTGTTCTHANPCAVQISINTGSGLTVVYDQPGTVGNPLNAFNNEPTDFPSTSFNEAQPWQSVVCPLCIASGYTLQLGYADNEHTNPCPASGCFPQAVWGPAGATVFKGLGSPPDPALAGACGSTGHPVAADGTCYDGGALLITAPAATCPLTQGFWKTHPKAWPVTSLIIGGQTYTKAQLLTILDTPPAGGDASLILAHQLIAALLNIANGSDPTPISATIADAQSLLIGCNLNSGPGCGVDASSTLGQKMVADANVLDSYNEGQLTPTCVGPS